MVSSVTIIEICSAPRRVHSSHRFQAYLGLKAILERFAGLMSLLLALGILKQELWGKHNGVRETQKNL
jgi:hypothetical protein